MIASADVTTSDGASYRVETFYRSPAEASASFISDNTTLIAVEGAHSWSRQGETEELAGDKEKRFIIGHQFHALALNFEEVANDITNVSRVEFDGGIYDGQQGRFPVGGAVTLLKNDNGRPHALILNLPDESAITVTYGDWRETPKGAVPYALAVSHEDRLFNYIYTSVSFVQSDTIDFHNANPAPELDAVKLHRLHRALLTAHCRGDAEMMAALTAPTGIVASRGEVLETTRAQTLSRFSSVFSRVDYTGYHDLKDPVVTVSEGGDIGWVMVNPLAEGNVKETGEPFSDQWAWVMLARKIDGIWLNAGNASNHKPAEE